MISSLVSHLIPALIAFAAAVSVALVLTPLVARVATRFRIHDAPDGHRRLHERPVPRLGGVAVFIAVLTAIALVQLVQGSGLERSRHLGGALLGAGVMFLVGLLDDIRGLPPAAKFAGQLAAATIAVMAGLSASEVGIVRDAHVHIGWFSVPLMVIWIVAVTNAFNLIDGLNGLATGIGIVACLGAATSAILMDRWVTVVPVFALAGALLGFLRFNFPKARVFLGDSGTMSIGFLLAMLLAESATTLHGSTLVLIPVFALMVPFLDTGLAIVRRWLRNVPLSGADARHIHHRLLALGMSPQRTVMALWALAGVFTIFGLLVSLAPPVFAGAISAVGVLVLTVVVIYGTNLLAYDELRIAREVLVEGPSRIRRVISDQIIATELCQSISGASSLREVNALLKSGAASFGFMQMELRAASPDQPSGVRSRTDRSAGWRLDFFVRSARSGQGGEMTLSIWCNAHGSRLSGAERVARVLAPAIASWMTVSEKADVVDIARGLRHAASDTETITQRVNGPVTITTGSTHRDAQGAL